MGSVNMNCKIHIQAGNLNIEFEGSEAFVKKDLLTFIEKATLHFQNLEMPVMDTETENKQEPKRGKKTIQATTNNIASKLKVTSGSGLIIAACAHLYFVKNKETFTRKEITTEMKNAKNYFKDTYQKNLTNALSTLINKEKLIERSKDIYALNINTINELEAILAP